MIETGHGNAAYYADLLYAVTILAVTAPPGHRTAPPRSWNASTPAGWRPPGGGTYPAEADHVRAAARHPGTSSSATPPCSAGGAARWTVLALWTRLTPGISFWKALASRPSPRPRRWR